MGHIPIKVIAEDPLVGCSDQLGDDAGSWENMLNFLVSNLSLITNSELADQLSGAIAIESSESGIDQSQYIVNELQYEIRQRMLGSLKTTNEQFETVLLNRWSKYLLRDHDTNQVLDFITFVKSNRTKRYNSFPII
jgi:hypothetical protein